MKISYNRLKSLVPDLDVDIKQLCSDLTAKSCEVERYYPIRFDLEKIFSGKIVELNAHPSSTKLHIAKVNVNSNSLINEGYLQIVCGAQNLYIGQIVAVVLPGGKVYSSIDKSVVNISVREVLGIKSEGMICSPRELGLGDSHEFILELPEDFQVGIDLLTDGLNPDYIIEIENKSISHRGDMFSHLGIAREVCAIYNKSLKELSHAHSFKIPEVNQKNIFIKNYSEKCKRFSGVVLDNLQVKNSPLWLQTFLYDMDCKPINNIVDITNFVMLELGQPMHSYDYEKLTGEEIQIRDLMDAEKFVTLDNIERNLDKGVTIVGNGNLVYGVGGIIGGIETSINDKTRTIFLEAANFEKFSIRKSSRAINVRTDASTRFEKGVDIDGTLNAIQYAISLLNDLTTCDAITEIFDIYPNPEPDKIVEFDFNQIQRVIGVDIPKDKVVKILKSLGFNTDHSAFVKVDGVNPVVNTSFLNLIIPSFRNDINISQDILEEIIRIYGYENLEPTTPALKLKPIFINQISQFERYTKQLLINNNFSESLSYSFVNPQDYSRLGLNKDELVNLENPLMPELSSIRNDLLPSLVLNLEKHIKSEGLVDIGLFELSRTTRRNFEEDGNYYQPWTLAFIKFSKNKSYYLTINQILFEILNFYNINYSIKYLTELNPESLIANPELFKFSQSGVIECLDNNRKVNVAKFGKASSKLLKTLGFDKNDLELCSINIDLLVKLGKPQSKYDNNWHVTKRNFDVSYICSQSILSSKIVGYISTLQILGMYKVEVSNIYKSATNQFVITLSYNVESNIDFRASLIEINKLLKTEFNLTAKI